MKKIILVIVVVILIILLWPRKKVEVIEEVDIAKKIKVEIKGAVNKPGVYELELGKRVEDVINLSGGLLANADISTINLSKNLKDEMVVIIYTIDEINEMREGSTTIKYIDSVCVCPQIKNDACIEDSITNIEDETIEDNTLENESTNGKVSLNKGTLEELMTLSGIGEKKALAIIEYRNNTPFKSIDEIMNIKGIGSSTYEKIKDNLTL